MNKPILKLFGGILLLAVLGLLYGGFLLMMNTVVNGVYDLDSQAAKIDMINSSVGSIRDRGDFVETRELEKFTSKAALSSIAARGLVQNDWDGTSQNYNNGAIVTVSGDRIDYPEDYPQERMIDASSLTEEFGMVRRNVEQDADVQGDTWLVEYFLIGSNVYYLECEKSSVLEEKARISFDAAGRLKGIEDALGIRVLIISEEKDQDGNHTLLYKSDALPEWISTAQDCGVTDGMLKAAADGTKSVTAEKLLESSEYVEVDGASYQVCVQRANGSELSEENVYLVYLIPGDAFISMTIEQTAVILAVFLIIGVFLLVWYFSLIRLVRHYRLNEEQAHQAGLKNTAKKAFSVIAIGFVVICLSAALFLALFRLFGVCSSVKKTMKVLEKRIEESKEREKTTVDELKNTYVSYAERIAEILKEKPELMTKEDLQSFSDLISADYIMVYDNDGREVISNSNYVDMKFGTTPESSTYEFRRLLKGIPSVVHDVKTDEETGLKNSLIGVCMEYPGESDTYGALLVAVPEEELVPEDLETMDDVLSSIVTDGSFSFCVDPENKLITNASDPAMIGRNATSLELPEAALSDSYRDFFTFHDTTCYGESKNIDGLLYYYAAEQPYIYRNVLLYAVLAGAGSFVLLSVLIGYMLFGYRKGFEYWSKEGEDLVERMDEGDALNEDSESQEDPRKRWKLSLSRFGMRTPSRNATMTLEILMVAGIIGIAIWYYLDGESKSGSLLNFVMHGQWTKGLNIFSLLSILILFAQVLIVIAILKILIRIVSSSMGSRGETFRRLALNLLTYAGMIFFVIVALSKLGINLGTLLASLSLPAFALSLGAKDLITDIVAGISIVFDGEFKVGDIIDINGYRGTVLEIGVRTTKLQGLGSNIKIISNRDVKNVTNMSKKTSWYNLNVKISTNYRMKDVEEMLKEELPKIQGTVPGIISGPIYRGVDAIGDKAITLAFSAECEEANYFLAKREMNHAILNLFDEQEIAIK